MNRAERPTYHHGNLRAAVLERAAQLAANGGSGALSLRALARELGVSPAALYRHFAHKDALLDELAGRALAALEVALREALDREASADPAARLAALVAATSLLRGPIRTPFASSSSCGEMPWRTRSRQSPTRCC